MTKKEFEQQKNQFINFLREEKQRSSNTWRAYQGDLNQFFTFWQELDAQTETLTNPLHNALTETDIGAGVRPETPIGTALEKFLHTRAKSDIDKSSIARKVSCFNSFKKFLKSQQITVNCSIKRPAINLKTPQTLSVEHMSYLLDQIPDDALPTKRPLRDKAILELLYATGVRVSELVQIELGAISLTHKSIIIRSKRAKERVVFFGTAAHNRIKLYLETERPVSYNPHECLFVNYQNGPLTTRSVQRICAMFRPFLIKNQLTPCLLRHSFANHMLSSGADLGLVQELLGHKTQISTQRYKKPGIVS